MSDYGISQNQPIQRYNYPVVGKKKENKQENMQKAATCTLATVAGVVLTMLVGYGIVNKGGSAKKVVDGAKKGAQEVARKKNTESSISNINTMFKSLEKINNGETLDSKDIKAEIDILTVYKTTIFIPQVNQHISSYIRLLEQVLNDNPNSKNIDKDKYEKIFTNKNKGKIKIDEILALTQKEKELKEKLAQQQLDFEDLTLNGENKITKNGHSIEIKESFDDLDKFSNLVQLRYNIYYDSKDDGTIYIFKDEKYHKVNISELVNLNPIKKNNGHKFLDPSQVNYIDKTAAVENVTIDGNNIQCIKGVKKADTDTDTDLYIKVRDLTENAIATIVNTDASQLDNRDGILNAINANCSSETIGKVLANDDLKDKLVDTTTGDPKDAGATLITGWVDSHKDQAADIASALNEIKAFGANSVGAAFVNAIKAKCKPATIGQVLDKLVDASGNPTDAGTTLITGWVTSNNDKANNIASALKEIKEFGDKSVGAAFVNAIKAKCSSETIGQVLANAGLKDKLVDTTTGDLKDAGDTLITGWVTSNNDKAKNIASALNEIKAFGANSVGAAFVNAIKANCSSETIGKVLANDDLKDKLVDTTTGDPKDAGATLITGWVDSHKDQAADIASALNEIKAFGANSVGAAFVNAIKAKCKPATIGQVLDKLVDASGNPTDAGTTLITGWVTSNKKNVDGIASALKEINEFGDNSVGAAFVNAINAKCEPGTIKRILTNLFGTNKDIEITSDSKEQLLLDVLFTKISLSEFETFIKGAKIKTYILKDKTYKDSISVQDSVFKLKIKTYTKLYFSSKEGTYDDETPSFEKYLLQQCGIDTTTIHNTEYNKIYIDDSKDKEQKIKLSLNAYKDDELVETKDNKLLLTGAAMNLISTHCTGDNNLDELKYDKVKQEEPNSNWSFRKKGNKEDSTITISGITFKYYVEPDTDTLYIRRAKHQPQP